MGSKPKFVVGQEVDVFNSSSGTFRARSKVASVTTRAVRLETWGSYEFTWKDVPPRGKYFASHSVFILPEDADNDAMSELPDILNDAAMKAWDLPSKFRRISEQTLPKEQGISSVRDVVRAYEEMLAPLKAWLEKHGGANA